MNLFIYVITGACMGASVLVARFFGENFPACASSSLSGGGLVLVALGWASETALATSSAQLLSALLCLRWHIRKKQPFLMIQRSDMPRTR